MNEEKRALNEQTATTEEEEEEEKNAFENELKKKNTERNGMTA